MVNWIFWLLLAICSCSSSITDNHLVFHNINILNPTAVCADGLAPWTALFRLSGLEGSPTHGSSVLVSIAGPAGELAIHHAGKGFVGVYRDPGDDLAAVEVLYAPHMADASKPIQGVHVREHDVLVAILPHTEDAEAIDPTALSGAMIGIIADDPVQFEGWVDRLMDYIQDTRVTILLGTVGRKAVAMAARTYGIIHSEDFGQSYLQIEEARGAAYQVNERNEADQNYDDDDDIGTDFSSSVPYPLSAEEEEIDDTANVGTTGAPPTPILNSSWLPSFPFPSNFAQSPYFAFLQTSSGGSSLPAHLLESSDPMTEPPRTPGYTLSPAVTEVNAQQSLRSGTAIDSPVAPSPAQSSAHTPGNDGPAPDHRGASPSLLNSSGPFSYFSWSFLRSSPFSQILGNSDPPAEAVSTTENPAAQQRPCFPPMRLQSSSAGGSQVAPPHTNEEVDSTQDHGDRHKRKSSRTGSPQEPSRKRPRKEDD